MKKQDPLIDITIPFLKICSLMDNEEMEYLIMLIE